MKDFVKMICAVICAFIIMSALSCVLFIGMLGAIAASGSGKTVIPKSAVLTVDMSKLTIGEQTLESNPFSSLSIPVGGASMFSASNETIGIWDAVQAVNAAAEDPAIKFIYLRTDGSSTGVSTLYEFRKALQNFRETSGKPVVSYVEAPGTGSYYLASVADKVYMTSHPGATITVNGVSAQMIFLGDLLKKFGINVQLIRHGKYKSAGEMFTRSSSSPENREQYQRLIDSTWGSISAEIAESRGISVERLNEAIDNLELCLPADFVEAGLIDELLTREGLEDKLTTLFGVEKIKDVESISLFDYAGAKLLPSKAKQKIAIIYADGEIVDGHATSEVAGSRFASIISKVRVDSTVKAVVFRVNSPGGSVLASEKIKNEIDLLKAEKPVIASYGEYAASGGYWISNNCDRIYSDATTLTGSIGVFGMVPDLSKALSDIAHVGVETVTSNKHGDMYGLMRPFDKDEYNYMLRSIEDIYDRFTTIVSEGRGIPKETVDEIGQGRVWTGADGLVIHLVDEIGTLEDAVKYAATVAGDPDLASWKVCGYPKPEDQMTQVLNMLSGNNDNEDVLVKRYRDLSSVQYVARLPYELEIK